ncbi:ABC transporter permease subunit [Breoghania sp. L-A4]|uniref:ABC transporter permease n=1 Tax=Breoghania sp. L-A4 TaxID=2304600 RepID=UPI003204E872
MLIIHDPLGLAMMLGLIAKEVPFLFLMVLAALPQTDAERLMRVSGSFGYGRISGWMKIVLPRIYPKIRLPVLAVIVYASSVVDVALILGPTRPPTLAVQLTRWMNDPDLAMRFQASAGAMLQLGVTAAAIILWLAGERLVARLAGSMLADGRRYPRDIGPRALMACATALLAALVIGGVLALVPWSFAGLWSFPDPLPRAMTLANWSQALPQAGAAIATTLSVGLGALACATILTIGCLENELRTSRPISRRALVLVYAPLLVPQVAFLFGLQFLFLVSGVGSRWIALVAAHFLFVLPYMFLSLGDPWRAWDMRYAHVAAGLGAGPARIFWRIRLPMMLRPILTAAAVGFAVSVSQYLPTLLIGGGRWATVTTEAVALASGGNRRLIAIYALIQMALPFFGFAIALGVPALLYRNRAAMRHSE